MKLGIYGGTFNPPHLGHLTSARLALDALGLDELRFVPAALPPHKRLPPDAPGPEARLEMVELAADGLVRHQLPDLVGILPAQRPQPQSFRIILLHHRSISSPTGQWSLPNTSV